LDSGFSIWYSCNAQVEEIDMALEKTQFSVLLYGLEKVLNFTAKRHPSFRERLKGKKKRGEIKKLRASLD
jgi:hypothetical protein